MGNGQRVTVGICAYNEEANIGHTLKAVTQYNYEVIVVASGCTDRTEEIVRGFNGVKLISQPKREGKASAVNLILESAHGDIIILQGADVIPSAFCYKYLLQPLSLEDVGMTGAHPVPVNEHGSLINDMAILLWDVHHQSALINPKAGEICAFRNIVKRIDPTTLVDEASIEHQIVSQGYRVVYAQHAIAFNRGCTTLADFMKQRKRIFKGHCELKNRGYTVPTMSLLNLVNATIRALDWDLYKLRALPALTALEIWARHQAARQYKANSPGVWDMCQTTKRLL